jgi:hypothetical protein
MKWLNFQVGAGASTITGSASANKSALLGSDASRTKALFKGYIESTFMNNLIYTFGIIL